MIPAIRKALPLLALALGYGCMPSPTLTPLPAPATSADSGRAGGLHVTVKPYAEVIPKDAKTRVGLFITHRVGDSLYFEIPRRELDRDMLLVGRLARTVRWTRAIRSAHTVATNSVSARSGGSVPAIA